jgi:uncharacterized protein
MGLKDAIQADIKTALVAKDKAQVGVLRLITAAIKQREVDERITLSDEEIILTLDKMQKQRKESLHLYEKAGREDLAAQERYELTLLQHYMPTPLSETEIDDYIQKAIADHGSRSLRDMGKIIASLKPLLQGRADLALVSKKVKDQLE